MVIDYNKLAHFIKSHFKMEITLVEQVKTDDKSSFKVIDSIVENLRRTDFINDLNEDKIKGIKHPIQFVMGKPHQFQLNTLYIRNDGEFIWVWVEKGDSN